MIPMDMKRGKHLSSLILLLGVTMLLFSCSTNAQQETNKIVEMWQSDSIGCAKIRTKELSNLMIDSFHLDSTDEENFIKYFGNPNMRALRNDNLVLSYYFDRICRDNKFVEGSDYCIAEFTFEKGRLVQRNYICQ